MNQTELTNKIDAYLETHWDAMVEDIATLVRIPSFEELTRRPRRAVRPRPTKAL